MITVLIHWINSHYKIESSGLEVVTLLVDLVLTIVIVAALKT